MSGFRACRVRTLFTLPPHLQHLHPGTLAYIELFTTFNDSISLVHQMHTLSLDRRDGRRRVLIIPTALLMMGCHLAPHFDQLDRRQLGFDVDVLAIGRHFFLNQYYNHFFYLFLRYWRRIC
jgi:hypothetical protein